MKFTIFVFTLLSFIWLGTFTEVLWDDRAVQANAYEQMLAQQQIEINMLGETLAIYDSWNDPDKIYLNPIHVEDYKKMTSAYGYRILHNPFTGGNTDSDHKGIDLVGTYHARVVAVADGVVVEHWPAPNGYFKGHDLLGGCIIIELDDGRTVVYGHLSVTYVNQTDKRFVKRGQVIGRTGETGMAFGEHLHFELLEGDQHLQPLQYVDVSK